MIRPADSAIEAKLVEVARRLLADGRVDLVLGHRDGALPLRTRPAFVTAETADARADTLRWNPLCGPNLAVYLPRLVGRGVDPERRPTVGIVAKGCDARAIVGLLNERQVPRDKVVILGVPCEGVVDLHKIERALGGAEVQELTADGPDGTLTAIDHLGARSELALADVLRDACATCRHPTPVLYDELLGEPVAPRQAEAHHAAADALEQLSAEARWERFEAELSKCIRCYACRQACPNCYCTECFAERTEPRWTSPGAEISEVAVFHLGRLLHMAGRCTECGACVAACPTGVDLQPYAEALSAEIEALYGSEASLAEGERSPLTVFDPEDDQSFMTEP